MLKYSDSCKTQNNFLFATQMRCFVGKETGGGGVFVLLQAISKSVYRSKVEYSF